MYSVSLNVFRYRMSYALLAGSVATMNALAHLQSSMLEVTRPMSGHILPTLIGGVIGILMASSRVSYLEKSEEQKRMFVNIVQSLSVALDERDAYTFGHSSRVTDFAMALGNRAGLSRFQLEALEIGSILHDIGKIGIPDTILKKPQALSSEEIDMIRQHPIKGERIIGLSQNKKINMIVACIRSHHERYDGSGYPDALRGEDIPVLGRIVAIADAYDAMTSVRPYHRKLTPEEALEELARCSGTQFDPVLSLEFAELMTAADGPAGLQPLACPW